MKSLRPTLFGRYAVAEPLRADTLHLYRGEQLRQTDFEPPIPVLDQEDLLAQGVHTSQFIPGCTQDIDALGSCVANASTASLAERKHAAGAGMPQLDGFSLGVDPVRDENFAIVLYHLITDQTGDPSQEWPPTDCGSSGLYACQELIRQGQIQSYRSATEMHALASLLQSGTVITGAPWFTAWMEPDASGFVDGDGSIGALDRAIQSGVAGGHETCIAALERLTFNRLGLIDPDKSHIRVRNSWGSSWSDHGSYRIHLSTLQLLGSHADYKQFVVTGSPPAA